MFASFLGKMDGVKVVVGPERRQEKWRSMKPFAKTAVLRDLTRRIAIIKRED